MSKKTGWLPIIISFGAVICWGTIWKILLTSQPVLGLSTDLSPSQIVSLTNLKRLEAGVVPLFPNLKLDQAATAKADDMIARGYFDHLDPDGVGSWGYLDQIGYIYHYAGENLARNFSSAVTLVDAWMDSPSHRDNLLSSHYTDIGIAVVSHGRQVYVVQILASPVPAGWQVDDGLDRPFVYSTPLVGKYLLSDNYFLSSLFLSFSLTVLLAFTIWQVGRWLNHRFKLAKLTKFGKHPK